MPHYLDHAATTPMRPAAREAWLAAADEVGNPSSLHAAGRAARARVEDARERIAGALGAHPTEVILTSGATEANNLAIKGAVLAASAPGGARPRVITTATEHHAVLDAVRSLASWGAADAVELPVEASGAVRLDALAEALDGAFGGAPGEARSPSATLVAIHWVNNEVGTVQPISDVVAAASEAGVPVHSDAVQALGHVKVDFAASGLSSMAVSAHKLGGPVGVGALVLRRDVKLTPLLHGGGQQRFRSGTLDAPDAAAFAAALELAVAEREAEALRLGELKALLVAGVLAAVAGARVSGAVEGELVSGEPDVMSPHIAHLVIPGASAEAMLFGLDQRGIAASSGSACTAGVVDVSHVLLAMGATPIEAAQTLRLSLGHTSTRADVDALLAALPDVVARARASAG